MSASISIPLPGAVVAWNGHMDLDGWGWVLLTLGMIAFWGLLVMLVVWIVRETRKRPPGAESDVPAGGPSDLTAILERRLAKCGISVEEYCTTRGASVGGPARSKSVEVPTTADGSSATRSSHAGIG